MKNIFTLFTVLSFSTPVLASEWIKAPAHTNPHKKEEAISGKITLTTALEKELKKSGKLSFTDSDVIYVIAMEGRNAPPAAVIKADHLKGQSFPIDFSLSSKNMMMGDRKLSGKYFLKIKLSRSGDASTSVGDLIGYSKEAYKIGTKGVSIAFDSIAKTSKPIAMDSRARRLSKDMMAKGTMPSNHPPVSKTTRMMQAAKEQIAKSDGRVVKGTVVLSKALEKQLKKSGFKLASFNALFVVAKEAGSPRPMPLAAVKITDLKGKKFPISFEVTKANMMGGGAKGLDRKLALKVKLLKRPGIMTNPGDLYSDYIDIGMKTDGITLTLDKIK